jgi:hypothetical protein
MDHVSSRIIRRKLGLLKLAEELGNVSKACKIIGLSRDTFYRYQAAVEERRCRGAVRGQPAQAQLQVPHR